MNQWMEQVESIGKLVGLITFKSVGGDTNAFKLEDQGDGSFILYSQVSLDYESLRKNYTLEVQASSEHMITKATVVVNLQDVNDNRPVLKDFLIIINNYGYVSMNIQYG